LILYNISKFILAIFIRFYHKGILQSQNYNCLKNKIKIYGGD